MKQKLIKKSFFSFVHKPNINKKIKKSQCIFPYNWTFKNSKFPKDKGKVFSCFACGGGSTMGYKLAGFDVIGCNEIDPKMMALYKVNHNPKYSFLEKIQTFKLRTDLPKELYELDILDGSPPCSSFSMCGNREKDWGKEKIFAEGQALQVLDTLFFDFIDLAKKLQPKVVIAENVKGLLLGNAKKYVKKILKEFDAAGYYCQYKLLDSSKMGVPQKRERVFFIALRKDLATPFLQKINLLNHLPRLNLKFNISKINFKEIVDNSDTSIIKTGPIKHIKLWHKCAPGEQFSIHHPKGSYFNKSKADFLNCLPTLLTDGYGIWHPTICRLLNKKEYCKAGTFPQDYNFDTINFKYVIGMSVPPVMIAQIATEIHNQWLSKI